MNIFWLPLFPALKHECSRRGITFDKPALARQFFATDLPHAKTTDGHILVNELLLPYITWVLLGPRDGAS